MKKEKTLVERLGFRRMDEMEQQIVASAQRRAYFFLVAALFCWCCYESWHTYQTGLRPNLIPSLLLVSTCLVQTITQTAMQHRAGQGAEEPEEQSNLGKLVVAALAVAAVIAGLGAWLLQSR